MIDTLIIRFGKKNKTKIIASQSSNSRMFLISKYQNPNAKVCLEININIIDEIAVAVMPFPFAYQHI